MSEQTVTTIVVAAFGFLTTCATSVAAYFMLKLKQQAALAALEVKQVKTTLEDSNKKTEVKLEKMSGVADATHKLVNSAMSVQLQLVATALRRVANLTKDKHDGMVASEAEERLYEHQSKQQAVDSKHPGGVPDAGD